MGKICCIDKNDVYKYDLHTVESISSIEDVSTVLDTFKAVLANYSSSDVCDMLTDGLGHYVFLVRRGMCSNFDFYSVLNSLYTGDTEINCVNAFLMFSPVNSRGLCYEEDILKSSSVDEDDDDSATSFMDEDDMQDIVKGGVYQLNHIRRGVTVMISPKGMVLGRSTKTSDYIIRGNQNVGRNHCKLYYEGNNLVVSDLDSKNGTLVNCINIGKGGKHILEHGDTLMLSDEEFKIL